MYVSLLLNSDPVACSSKVNVSVGWKGKVYLLRRLVTWGKGGLMSKRRLRIADQGARAFKGEFQGYIDRGRKLNAETTQSALTASLKWFICGLTSVILIVLSTVNLQLHRQFVLISLKPVLGIVAA